MQNQRSPENEIRDCIVCGCAAFYDDEAQAHIHPQCKDKKPESNLHPIFESLFGSFMPAQEVQE